MSQPAKPDTCLTRRHWMVLAASAVSAGCGGGATSIAGLPGTGGTGVIFTQGTISGFGSVIINGVRFDDTAARVMLDGQTLSATDLRLGMVATVQGERGADVTLGTASSIEVWSIAQGLVSSGRAVPGATGEFTVAGMTVRTDPGTVFEGSSAAMPLMPGQRVAVWGLQAGVDARSWSATRVASVSASSVVSTGLIGVSNSQRSLNGMMLAGDPVRGLADGALVRALGALSTADGALLVQSVQLLGVGAATPLQGEVEIEGVVTSMASAASFNLGNIAVDASQASYKPAGAQISRGARLQVNGSWQSGVLKASSIELEDEQSPKTVEISGRIELFTSLANFVLRGQRCDASGVTVSPGTVADLKVGVKVKLKGLKAGDVLRVTALGLDD
ncbi:MAG: DUF5666 domain-containing protein [Rhodoferax sp.]